ncbi:unnamed protein product, partial [Rotaria sp. Silwood2]
MVPSMFIVLKQLPLNTNGKIDRKLLPTPNFPGLCNLNESDQVSLTLLEERLLSIFAKAFHVESPDVNASFGELGGTSLDAIVAVTMIREQVSKNVDIGLFSDNPSVRQLARVIAALGDVQKDVTTISVTTQFKHDHHRPMPSLLIEALGVLFLVCQWLSPIWIA